MRNQTRTAAVVAVLVAGVLAGPELAAGVPAGGDTTLPARFAGPSPLTASVSDAPPGPAIALIRQKFLFFNRDQIVVVAVDGRTYRRLDLADRRGAPAQRGEWVPGDALLAPDGSAAAVADPVRVRDRIEVVDLRTGRITAHRLDRPAAVRLLDWSPDGRWLALLLDAGPRNDATDRSGQPAVLDLRTGTVRRFDQLVEPWWFGASFAPDSARLAFVTTRALPTADRYVSTPVAIIVDLAGTELRVLPIGDLFTDLARAAWSPDGRWLVMPKSSPTGWSQAFLDVTGQQAPVPAPVPQNGSLVSWRSPTTMLFVAGTDLVEVPAAGGQPRPVSRLPAEINGRQHSLQLADGLVAAAKVRDAGGPRRGPWPWWWRLTLSGVALLSVLLIVVIRRRWSLGTALRPARRRSPR